MAANESSTPRHSVSVAAAVRDGRGRFLAIRRRDNGKWEPPGGVLELEETFEQGVVREVLEETGLQVTPVRLSGIYKNMTIGVVALVFECELTGGLAYSTEEVSEARWLGPAEVSELMDPAYAVRLLDALNNATVVMRYHNGIGLLPDPLIQR